MSRLCHTVEDQDIRAAIASSRPVRAVCGYEWVPIAEDRAASAYPPCPTCHPGRNRPRPTYVYRCYDADGRLLYVGCSSSPRTRMDSHRATTWWFGQVASVRMVVFPDREYGLAKEREAIATENPRWNIKGRWPQRSTWVAQDYADYHMALTMSPNKGLATAKHMDLVASEARRRYGLELEPLADTA